MDCPASTFSAFMSPAPQPSSKCVRLRPPTVVPEDPVCGSGNGCVAALVRRDKVLDSNYYVASQGQCLRRDGRIMVRFAGDDIWIGGHAVTCIEGALGDHALSSILRFALPTSIRSVSSTQPTKEAT